MELNEAFEKLAEIIAKLRDPRQGCPWDREQTHESLRPFLIEECYEFLDALDSHPADMAEELGDILLQLLLHAQIAAESGSFDLRIVIDKLADKLIRRHPHVFGNQTADTSAEVLKNWQAIKQSEYAKRKSRLEGVPLALPALHLAQELGKRAAKVNFDWDSPAAVRAKVIEELDEFLEHGPENRRQREEEFGDFLFSITQLARKCDLNAEDALRGACAKFSRRFRQLEEAAGDGISSMTFAELEKLWQAVKSSEV